METQIYIASTEALEDQEKFERLYQSVSAYRKMKIDRYKTPAEKRLSLAVGLLLAQALNKEGLDEKSMQVLTKDNGRPYFKDHEEIYFSLSHSGERAMCAVSSRPIGCDVQLLDPSLGIDLENWPKMEAYSKASDTPMVYLMGGKSTYSKEFSFKTVELEPDYTYIICSKDKIADTQIHKIEL